jgi:uncharacterized membrane protein YczE
LALDDKTNTDDDEGMRQLPRRVTQLYVGLALYAVSMALVIQSGLGNMPWDVFHQGMARRTGLSIGFWVIAFGVLILLVWVPLRQRPGLGTVSNIVVIGLLIDPVLGLVPRHEPLGVRVAFLVVGVLLNGVATALYVGARMGPGPRDGLMTGLVARTGRSVRLVRTSIEVTVVVAGILLGGTFGVGTLLYAVAIGPLVQLFLPRFTVPVRSPAAVPRSTGPDAVPAVGRTTLGG